MCDGRTDPGDTLARYRVLSQIVTKLRDWAIGQAWGSCYSQAALSSNDSKTRTHHPSTFWPLLSFELFKRGASSQCRHSTDLLRRRTIVLLLSSLVLGERERERERERELMYDLSALMFRDKSGETLAILSFCKTCRRCRRLG